MNSTHKPLGYVAALALVVLGCAGRPERAALERQKPRPPVLPLADFDHPPGSPYSRDDYAFKLEQLEYFYRVPGEFGFRLRGEDYGFESLSFIITDTHPNGGPPLHSHDVEEAHVLLDGSAEYLIGDHTFTVQGPYIVRVPAGVPHTFCNVGTAPFSLIAVFASKRHGTTRLAPNPLVREESPPITHPADRHHLAQDGDGIEQAKSRHSLSRPVPAPDP